MMIFLKSILLAKLMRGVCYFGLSTYTWIELWIVLTTKLFSMLLNFMELISVIKLTHSLKSCTRRRVDRQYKQTNPKHIIQGAQM